MGHRSNGILLIDKVEGKTSFDVVRQVKSALGKSGVRKIGHAGTLDPFATGLLVILLGQGTKLSNFIMSGDKVYLATMRLGLETETLDYTGQIIGTAVVPDLNPEFIQQKTEKFTGLIKQTPPMFSAVKYKGTRAYKLARKGVEMKLKSREVQVHSIKIISVDLPDVTMKIRCSSGTYIRTLAADLGRELGPGAHLKSLRRLASGSFQVDDALNSELISKKQHCSLFRDRVIPLSDALPNMLEIKIGDILSKKIRHGYQPALDEMINNPGFSENKNTRFKLTRSGELVAIVRANKYRRGRRENIKIERVF
ncbi:MAG: tRNA pseudouridine(55) synthase TruB [Desulfobacterales bacterium]|nr:tRNA pseudouridine(55) synthase TruB [Desulfobacterales bacterium]